MFYQRFCINIFYYFHKRVYKQFLFLCKRFITTRIYALLATRATCCEFNEFDSCYSWPCGTWNGGNMNCAIRSWSTKSRYVVSPAIDNGALRSERSLDAECRTETLGIASRRAFVSGLKQCRAVGFTGGDLASVEGSCTCHSR